MVVGAALRRVSVSAAAAVTRAAMLSQFAKKKVDVPALDDWYLKDLHAAIASR